MEKGNSAVGDGVLDCKGMKASALILLWPALLARNGKHAPDRDPCTWMKPKGPQGLGPSSFSPRAASRQGF